MTHAPIRPPRPRRTWGEVWQGIAYGTFGTWVVLFFIFPPQAFAFALAPAVRAFWLLAALTGCVAALIGLITRLDLKVELPGLMFMMFGPLAYCGSQIYYILFGVPPGYTGPPIVPADRYALVVYALIPAALLQVRIWQLWSQARQAKQARLASARAAAELLRTGQTMVQTGAIKVVATTRKPAHEIHRDAENQTPGRER